MKNTSIKPITGVEHNNRVTMALKLMAENKIDAMILEPGANMQYFTGVDWYISERLMIALITSGGEIIFICPEFEEQRLRELIDENQVYVWSEHQDPYKILSEVITKLNCEKSRIALDNALRYFVYRNLVKEIPDAIFTSSDPVIIPCRSRKSPAEITLMQQANDITAAAIKHSISELTEGQSQLEFRKTYLTVLEKYGVTGSIDVQFGAGTAFPHGSSELSFVQEGDMVLMDGQCQVEGYWSDITRTIVFGEPNQRQLDVWNLEKEAQAAAFAAAQPGNACETVDAAARSVIENAGFGPGYKVPGLPHRTGHGIGLDIHEHYYMVKGNRTALAAGMCFTIEPTIAIYGEFGIRLEDCVYMTEDGPQYFSQPSPGIDQPFINE